jgi:hypothetical protein
LAKKEEVGKTKNRSYPAVYEKVLPIAMGILVILFVGMLAVAIGIATGLINAG